MNNDKTGISFANSYVNLPGEFYSNTNPTPVENPELIIFNQSLADKLGLKINPDERESAAIFSGNELPQGAQPIAMAYAGHQFGGFSHQLGDGRAILLGEVIGQDGKRYDIQLKGSGPTPWSRSGDGRSALGPVLREYLVSEAMSKLGVPTTRALAAVTTGEQVARNTLVPGGILTRVASGFVRVGTFEYFSARRNIEAVRQLADYVIARHYPQALEAENPYEAFLVEVVDRQAKLIAQWMNLGFIHGVMNTDNMSIAGESIDYGPCAFMDDFDYGRVYSSIDRNGRYAYNKQPEIGLWNLIRLAESLLPLFVKGGSDKDAKAAVEIAQQLLGSYEGLYRSYWLSGMRRKLGMSEAHENDAELARELLDMMDGDKVDFTLLFYHLSRMELEQAQAMFAKSQAFDAWLVKWRKRLALESLNEAEHQAIMRAVNPVYIPRNHQIEAAIRAAEDHDDFSLFHALHEVLQNPFEVQQGKHDYSLPPLPEQIVRQTFCGT